MRAPTMWRKKANAHCTAVPVGAVSYTHLDVYKRQIFANAEFTEDREARMHDEQESQNNFQKLEELSREMGQKTAETIEDAIDTIKSDAEK